MSHVTEMAEAPAGAPPRRSRALQSNIGYTNTPMRGLRTVPVPLDLRTADWAGPVTITYADGRSETRPAYTVDELRAIRHRGAS